ncbi:MAG: 50S ribosomal protein L3 [SAR202 cluster bacterium]|nr:50S ribosomal protein L3 [SAR202 cluster bacterium]
MLLGTLGKKLGMTQMISEDGIVNAVTAVDVTPSTIVQIKTLDRDGYEKIQLGYGEANKISKPLQGHMKDLGEFRYLREVPVKDSSDHSLGDIVTADVFSVGDKISITGTSKGKGFAGPIKRYHFKGGPKSHGQKDKHRAPGSIGAGTTPGRVWKGQRMAGHMGMEKVTVRNLQIAAIDLESNIILVKGAVPGPPGNLLILRKKAERTL